MSYTEHLNELICEHTEKTGRRPKFIIVDFLGLVKIKQDYKDFIVWQVLDIDKPLKLMGIDVIKAEECLFILEEEK